MQFQQALYTPSPRKRARYRLVCFTHAGGTAANFRTWVNDMPEEIEVCAVEFPGRGFRFREPLHTSMHVLLETLMAELDVADPRPFAFFGHSLGGLVAFEIARRLQLEEGPVPTHLFLAACPSPLHVARRPKLHKLPHHDFYEVLERYGGMPREVLNNPQIMSIYEPVLRADFEIYESYRCELERPIAVHTTAFGGRDDATVDPSTLVDWQNYVTWFHLDIVKGDHFFPVSHRQELISRIVSQIGQRRVPTSPSGDTVHILRRGP